MVGPDYSGGTAAPSSLASSRGCPTRGRSDAIARVIPTAWWTTFDDSSSPRSSRGRAVESTLQQARRGVREARGCARFPRRIYGQSGRRAPTRASARARTARSSSQVAGRCSPLKRVDANWELDIFGGIAGRWKRRASLQAARRPESVLVSLMAEVDSTTSLPEPAAAHRPGDAEPAAPAKARSTSRGASSTRARAGAGPAAAPRLRSHHRRDDPALQQQAAQVMQRLSVLIALRRWRCRRARRRRPIPKPPAQ